MSPTKVNYMDAAHQGANQPLVQQAIRKSPKKRPLKRYTIVSSSSSTESLASDSKGNRLGTSENRNTDFYKRKNCTHNAHRTNQNWIIYHLVYLARFGLYLKGKSLKRSDNDSEKVHLSTLFLFLCCRKSYLCTCVVPIFISYVCLYIARSAPIYHQECAIVVIWFQNKEDRWIINILYSALSNVFWSTRFNAECNLKY